LFALVIGAVLHAIRDVVGIVGQHRQITDRSLEILSGMPSLEQIEFYECNGITDAGLTFLAGLPRLREVHLDSLPGVTLEGTLVFPAHVPVQYST